MGIYDPIIEPNSFLNVPQIDYNVGSEYNPGYMLDGFYDCNVMTDFQDAYLGGKRCNRDDILQDYDVLTPKRNCEEVLDDLSIFEEAPRKRQRLI